MSNSQLWRKRATNGYTFRYVVAYSCETGFSVVAVIKIKYRYNE